MSNWPNDFDLSHPNWTGSTPSHPQRGWQRFDGMGGYAPNSHKIPGLAWAGAAAVVALLFIFLPRVGAIAGF